MVKTTGMISSLMEFRVVTEYFRDKEAEAQRGDRQRLPG